MAIRFRERTIDDFKGRLVGGGARPNLFEVDIQLPQGLGIAGNEQNVQSTMRFMIKASQLPASTVGDIPVAFRGRVLHVAGDRTFDSWTITVINDTDFAIRSAFEKWMNAINRVSDATGSTDPASYQADAFVYQLDRSGETLRAYHFYDIFPTNVAPINLSYDTEGIQEFTVEMQVHWWEALKGRGPAAGGEDIN